MIVPAGVEQTQVGLFMAGDFEAGNLAEELRRVQDVHANVLATQMANDQQSLLDTMYSAVAPQSVSEYTATLCGVFRSKKPETADRIDPERKKLDDAYRAVLDVQDRLRRLAQ